MQSIAGWLGGSWKDNARLQVETLVYAAGVPRLFVRMADGRLYAVSYTHLNVDEQGELSMQFRLVSIPTLIVMKNGEVANTAVGAMPKEEILNLLGYNQNRI